MCLPNISEAKIWFYFLFCCPWCRSASFEGKCMCFWRWLYVVSMVSGGGRNENIFQITRVRFYDMCVVISVSAAHVLALQGSALITLPVFFSFQNFYSSFRSCRSVSHSLSFYRRDSSSPGATFYSPLSGFSLLAYEVTWLHTGTPHSR